MHRLRDYFTKFNRPVFRSITERYFRFLRLAIPETDEEVFDVTSNNVWVTGIDSLVRALPLDVKQDIQRAFALTYSPYPENIKKPGVLNTIIFDLFEARGLGVLVSNAALGKKMVLSLVRSFSSLSFFVCSITLSLLGLEHWRPQLH
jgi:hypothetical protein